MTQTQREQLLATVEKVVGEHCHSFIFAAEVDCDEVEHENQSDTTMIVFWNGGLTMAAGLASRLYHQLQKRDQVFWEDDHEDIKR
jgi:hypothetical protein